MWRPIQQMVCQVFNIRTQTTDILMCDEQNTDQLKTNNNVTVNAAMLYTKNNIQYSNNI